MQKRKIMIPLKEIPPPIVEEEKPPETQGIDEGKIFKPKKKKEPKNASLEIQQVANDKVDAIESEQSEESEEDLPPPVPVARRKHKPASEQRKAHLAMCREKSLETRRRKKQERELVLSRAQQIVEERDLELKKKKQYMNERVVEQPPPMPQQVLPQIRAEPEPTHQSISAVMDTRTQQINYDEITEKIYAKLKSDQQLSQIQQDIRREEQLKAQSSYEGMLKKFEEDQHRKYQRDMSYKMMAGKPNSVFMRSAAMQDRIRNRFNK